METHHVLFYDYVGDIVDRRGPFREAHLERIRSRDEIVMAGALGDPPHGAAIVFRGLEPREVAAFAHDDPYVRAGLVREWRVEPWRLV